MKRLMVINVVGLTSEMIGSDTPNLSRLAADGFQCPMKTVLPAVTCSVQASMMTGGMPSDHGIVGNGWFFRDLSEVMFWKQANQLVSGEKVFQTARFRNAEHTTACMFWWYNMYADVNWSMTPRPSYPADGRKIPDLYSSPADLRDDLQSRLGRFPLFHFWGPTADILSTRWIADSSIDLWKKQSPSLMLVYLPHLDYNLQRIGPHNPAIREDVHLIDHECVKLINASREAGAEVLVVSEYGITETTRVVHINRVLRDHGFLTVRREQLGWETLDCGASRAFAVADHQVAHVYLRNPSRDLAAVRKLLEGIDGIERVLDSEEQKTLGLLHPRTGDLVAVSARDSWFSYYFWMDDAVAPDYARTVDIHRKPAYDPAELLVNPDLKFPRLRVAARLLQKMLGFRYYMDVIGLKAEVVRGSHGRLQDPAHMLSTGRLPSVPPDPVKPSKCMSVTSEI